jgi:NADH dehydrogenase
VVTGFRPSIIFGEGDNFFGQFAAILRWLPVFPLVCPQARFAPVWGEDVAAAFVAVISHPPEQDSQKRYDLCGPREYSFKELIRFTADAMDRRRLVIGLPDWLARMQGRVLERLPGQLYYPG